MAVPVELYTHTWMSESGVHSKKVVSSCWTPKASVEAPKLQDNLEVILPAVVLSEEELSEHQKLVEQDKPQPSA